MDPGELPHARIHATQTHAPSGTPLTWRFPLVMTPQGTFDINGLRDVYVAGQLVRLYVDPGRPVVIDLRRSALGTRAVRFIVTISGDLVDAPQ